MEKTSNLQKSILTVKEATNNPLVSVIITTRNEEKNVGNCLRSIRAQSFKNIELIVVDNFSDDQTAAVAQEYTVNVYSKGPERSSQRNFGAKVSKGKYVLYLDADMILGSTVIEECVKKCEKEDLVALYIPERIVGTGFWIQVRDFERSFYTGTVIDAVRFVNKDLFLNLGGFDETLIGPEDWDFDRKVRQVGRTGIVNAELYHNERLFNLKRYLKKKSYYAEGLTTYIKKWGSTDQDIVKQTGVFYRLFGVFFENGNWKKLVRSPTLGLAMYYLRLRVAIAYLGNR